MKSIDKFLLLSTLTLLLPVYACGSKPTPGGTTTKDLGRDDSYSNVEGSNPGNGNAEPTAPAPSPTPGPLEESPAAQSPQIIEIKPDPAAPPYIVAGAASEISRPEIDCRSSADKKQIVCKLSKMRADKINRPRVAWSYLAADSSAESSLTAKTVILALPETTTYYIFDQAGINKGLIKANLLGITRSSGNVVSFPFDAAVERQAFVLPTND